MDTMTNQSWHLSKTFSIGVLITLISGISGMVWATSTAFNTLEKHEEYIVECKGTRLLTLEALNEMKVDIAVIKEKVNHITTSL